VEVLKSDYPGCFTSGSGGALAHPLVGMTEQPPYAAVSQPNISHLYKGLQMSFTWFARRYKQHSRETFAMLSHESVQGLHVNYRSEYLSPSMSFVQICSHGFSNMDRIPGGSDEILCIVGFAPSLMFCTRQIGAIETLPSPYRADISGH